MDSVRACLCTTATHGYASDTAFFCRFYLTSSAFWISLHVLFIFSFANSILRNLGMTSSTINTSAAEISFKELKLRPGTLLQVRRTVGDVNGSIDEAQFVTAIAGKGIMLSLIHI